MPSLDLADTEERASALLLVAQRQPPSIPTIQALLVLAGRQLAIGETDLGWLYSGMAFRMLERVGVDVASVQNSADDSEDAALRRQLFWSAQCWDKCAPPLASC